MPMPVTNQLVFEKKSYLACWSKCKLLSALIFGPITQHTAFNPLFSINDVICKNNFLISTEKSAKIPQPKTKAICMTRTTHQIIFFCFGLKKLNYRIGAVYIWL
jgi:hypothetical protein